jgi:hypothetical protein
MPDTATKVHIVLERDVAKDPEKRRHALAAIVDRFGIQDVNQSRLERFGIITGIVDSACIDEIRKMAEVRSVSVDEVRHVL